MNAEKLALLKSGKVADIQQILQDFNTQYASIINFADFHDQDDVWFALWRELFAMLKNDAFRVDLHSLCLNCVRILTRDKESLQRHNISDDCALLMKLAHLTTDDITADAEADVDAGMPADVCVIIVEALKCLCNLIYQNVECRRSCLKNHLPDAILKSIASPVQYPCTVEFYQMKLLFLLTALEPNARTRVQIDLNGSIHITEWLDEKLKETPHASEQLELISEMLKVMLNITSSPDKSPSNDNEIQNLHLTVVLRELLLIFDELSTTHERQVVCDAINLMTNISSSCLTELITKYDDAAVNSNSPAPLLFENYNVRALEVLLHYLRTVLKDQQSSAASQENLSPVLIVLIKCARSHAVMRHYIRSVVLPPLRDATQRPEVGNELRNYLCRFLTVPSQILRDLTAELLFIICKENVARMIKYTGYGNAAGLFATRGLLDCSSRRMENTEYSSDSEDSDTEEYKQQQNVINPVIGCVEPPRRNPLEGMSEEQKEYEAMQLVELMDKLHRSGVIQPCLIGGDGKPKPVDHILQLQEELPQQQLEQKHKT